MTPTPQGGPIVVIDCQGTQLAWPFNLMSLFRDVEDLIATLQDDLEDDEDEVEVELTEQALLAMTLMDLKALAVELDVRLARGQSKAEIVATLLEQTRQEVGV